MLAVVNTPGGPQPVAIREIAEPEPKPNEALVAVHELVGWPEQESETRAWREAFAQALANYEQKNLEFAEMGFRQVLQMRPNDGPSQFYLKQLAEHAQENLPGDTWATYTVLKEK